MSTPVLAGPGESLVQLSHLPPGIPAVIERLDGPPAAMLHLMEIGLCPGELVRVIRSAPGGDPLELDVMGYRLAIRRAEAGAILVRRKEGELHAR